MSSNTKNITIGVLVVALLVGFILYQGQRTVIELQEKKINQSAATSFAGLCDQSIHSSLWEAIENGEVFSAMTYLAWAHTELVGTSFWDERLIGTDNPFTLYSRMNNAKSLEDFSKYSKQLSQFCEDNWGVLYGRDTPIFPR